MFNILNDAIYELRIYCTMGAQTAINVRHYRATIDSAISPPKTSRDFMDFINTTISPLYSNVMSEAAGYQGLAMQEVSPQPNGPLDYRASPTPGTIPGDSLPTQTCGLIAFGTSGTNGINKSMAYIPFPAEFSNVGFGLPGPLYQAALGLLGDALASNFVMSQGTHNATLTPVAFRRGTQTSANITSARPRANWATQRSRGGFGKHNASPI